MRAKIMKTYAPNESPKVEDVEIGKQIFWKYEMQWVIPTKVGRSEMVWRMREDGREVWDTLQNYTYNPVIPERPKQKRKINLYLWKYVITGEYAAHQFPPDRDQEKDIKVVNRFDWEVEE